MVGKVDIFSEGEENLLLTIFVPCSSLLMPCCT